MANVTAASAGAGFTPEQEKILSKVLWRIVPFPAALLHRRLS